MTFEERVVILAHVGWGIALTMIIGLWLPLSIAAFFTALIAAGKEAIESIWGAWDKKQPWSSFVVDTAEFGLGILVAIVVVVIRNR